MTTRFVYEDTVGTRHVLTLKRASPEWCNFDCPPIFIESDDPNLHGMMLNFGVVIENLPIDIAVKFARFFKASSEAFYRKYPNIRNDEVNGFMLNFIRENDRIQNNVGNGPYWNRIKSAVEWGL